jgi:hypothetical protein
MNSAGCWIPENTFTADELITVAKISNIACS